MVTATVRIIKGSDNRGSTYVGTVGIFLIVLATYTVVYMIVYYSSMFQFFFINLLLSLF